MDVRRIWRDFGLSITLAVLFLVAGPYQTWTGWTAFAAEQLAHGQTPDRVRRRRLRLAVAPNRPSRHWQSEFLQIFVFIVLTTFLVHRKSHESPDTDYDTEAALRRIEAKVDALERKAAKG